MKTLIIAAKSFDNSEKYPPTDGCVRASTVISGWWIEERKAPQKGCVAKFYIQSDFKISLFVQKQVAPKASNYAGRIKEYIEN